MQLIVYSVLCILAVSGSPAHYDQRQEGTLNVHALLKNLYLVILVPSVEPPKPSVASEEIDSWPSVLEQLLEFKRDSTRNGITESGDKNFTENGLKHGRDANTNNNTDSHDEDSDKKNKNNNDTEQVTDHLESKLLGDGIENCGPDRFRDRFGICQFVTSLRN
ncbi:myb-like protein I [Cotesia glomerata]|uniref:Uncharacterized protein n=1 Tax=Cotesia glomerata TaxID=32391 RepID=A0AAV7J204_COTGL|nr:myb-like protein I [Cotesia glomerata]KAH0561326.1 hypothetical protein KQX54_016217 [Cotesia glomerata]